VTVAELKANLQIGTLYSDAIVEEVCQSSQDIVDSYLWYNEALVYSTALNNNIATITTTQPHGFVTGESVTITKSDTTTFNGTYTITGYTEFTFTYAKTASNQTTHLVRPYGLVRGPNHSTAYASVPAVREASLMIATDIWMARQAPSGQGVGIDFQPAPFKMGNTLVARCRGLLAPYLAPSSMVG
jgi:hypothetical protein